MRYTEITSFPTNWTNGMKLGADHFQHLENSMEGALQDARATALVSNVGYGLLPAAQFILRNSEGQNGRSVRVTLEACQAILPGGTRVEILPGNINGLQIPKHAPYVEFMPSADMRYHLFLTTDIGRRIGAGIPETRPIREPYLCPDYQLECIPHDKVGGVRELVANRMKVGEWKGGKIIEAYIPPCLQLGGFPALDKWYQFFRNQLENTVKISTHIIHEHRRTDPLKVAFCQPVMGFIRSSHGYYRWMLPQRSPAFFIAYFGDLAGLVKGHIEMQDRDFVRNVLKNGEVNGLLKSIDAFLSMKEIPLDDMASSIARIKRFVDALMSTLQILVSYKPPAPRAGERNIISG